MDAIAPVPQSTTDDASGVGEKLSAYARARRSRDRRRRILRGTIGIGAVLLLWQVMAVAYNLQQILPPPLVVARTILDTLTLNYQHWLYGPNIYEHLAASLVRAVSGILPSPPLSPFHLGSWSAAFARCGNLSIR